jgi:predicted signal transduction protein with EAL and GGDEF domain
MGLPERASQVEIAMSIGIALAPYDGSETEELLRNADLALYECKHHGSGLFAFCRTPPNRRHTATSLT